MKADVIIEFDGGTSCNVPRLGYGDGYGSYRIDREKPIRLRFYEAMSANVAEVRTLVAAIQEAKRTKPESILIIGDSRCALGWAEAASKNWDRNPSKASSDQFSKAIRLLYKELNGIKITTKWWPRKKSVAVFGH